MDHNQTKIVTLIPFSDITNWKQNASLCKDMKRVLDVEQGSFTPLVFGTNGGMGDECRKFVDELSRKLTEK